MVEIKISELPKTRKAAIEDGSKYYFTGVPCKRGHLAKRKTPNSFCQDCERDPKRILEKDRRRRIRNPEKFKEKNRLYRLSNLEKSRKESRKWHAANRKRMNEYLKNKYKSDINYKLRTLLRNSLKMRLRRGKYKTKAGSVENLLGCSIPHFRAWIESQWQEGMSWENNSFFGWHLDHKLPLASFDLTDPKQLAQACHFTNLQPLWAHENISKGAKVNVRR